MRRIFKTAAQCMTVLLLLAVCFASARAVEPESDTIQVQVRDSSGASVSGAKVVLRDETGNMVAEIATDATGAAILNQLRPGAYQIDVQRDGFASVHRQINLDSTSRQSTINVSLGVGGAKETVTVTAEDRVAGGQISTASQAGILGNLSIYDTPFSTVAFTDELIKNQQAQALSDVLANDPAVRVEYNRYSEDNSVVVRGFDVAPYETLFNGLPGLVDYRAVALDGVEKVELFKGPSSFLNGASASAAVGGTVNMVAKRAFDLPLAQFTGGYSSDKDFEGHMDAGCRFGAQKQFGLRSNLGGRFGETPIDNQLEHFAIATVAADYRGEKLHASIDANTASRSLLAALGNFSVLPGFDVPSAPKATINIFDRSESFVKHQTSVLGQMDYTFSPHTLVSGAYGHSLSNESYVGPYAPTITNSAGDAYVFNIPYFGRVINDSARVVFRTDVTTGPIHHQLTAAADLFRSDSGYSFGFLDQYDTNIYHPVALLPLVPRIVANKNPPRTGETQNASGALADVASMFSGRLTIIGGLRLQNLRTSSYDSTSGQFTGTYNKAVPSPSVAALYKLTSRLSVYGNYIQDLQQGPTAPTGTVNAGKIFAPNVAKQEEIGAKYDFGRAGATLALYRITQPNGIVNSTTNTFEVSGQQRNRGLELNVFGNVMPSLRLLGGLAMIDGTQISTGDLTTEGRKAPGVPLTQLTLGGEWTPPAAKSLTLTARTTATSSQFVDAQNTQPIPGWAKLDLGARYTVETRKLPTTFRVNVQNATGANYWQSALNSYMSAGAPRTLLMSGTMRF